MRRTILSSARTVERVVTGGARSGGSSWARAGVAVGGVTAAVLWCGDQRFALLEQADARLEAIALSRRSSLLSSEVDDVRINHISPIASPALLIEELPLTRHMADHVNESRAAIQGVLEGTDDRLIVVVGPCSIHDVDACREYALRLRRLQQLYEQDLLVVMRVYFEKPRTTVGWKGLINDPDLNGTNNINKGLRIARKFLLDVNELGLVAGVEFLDTITPQYIADLVVWGAIGARTTESQVHRQLASGMSCAIGFKNGTGGNVQVGVDACKSSSMPHSFLSVTKDGVAAAVHTTGNSDCHVILRGGSDGPNYSSEHINAAGALMEKSGIQGRLIIDCSHGNSCKDHKKQLGVVEAVCAQVAGGDKYIRGVMIESHIHAGKQTLKPGVTNVVHLKRGVSVTDACIDIATTEVALGVLSAAVKQRRSAN